ncbi:hypothetical protein [Arthrobacter sp. HLT1-20]
MSGVVDYRFTRVGSELLIPGPQGMAFHEVHNHDGGRLRPDYGADGGGRIPAPFVSSPASGDLSL